MPLVLLIALLLAGMAAFCFCCWLLIKDRKYWRDQYQQRDQEARAREQHLFDQLLRLKGFRATIEPNMPQSAIAHAPALDAEELAIIDDRINERVEAGVLTASEGHLWANQLRQGSLTPSQIERMLFSRQRNEFPGSVADID